MLTNLKQMVEKASDLAKSIDDEVQPLMFGTEASPLQTQIDFFFALKQLKEHGENIAKIFNLCESQLAGRINKLVTASGLEDVTVNVDGVRIKITPETKWFISCTKDKKENLIEWMKAHPEARELVKEDVHPKTLESFFKKMIQEGSVPPEMLSIHSAETIATRKLPNK